MEVRPPVQSGAQPPEPATAGVEGSDPPPLALRGTCERCRQSKVKCDKDLPRCGRCTRLNVPCQPRLKAAEDGATAGEDGGRGGAIPRREVKRKLMPPPPPPLPLPLPAALEAEVVSTHFIVSMLRYGSGLRREPSRQQGKGKPSGGRLLRDLPDGRVEELVTASIALSNWACLRQRFGADFSRGALGAMEEMLGPTPLPPLPPTAAVDIYPIACFRGLDACRDAPAELLALDDGQSALCIIAERPTTITVHLNLPFEELCMSYVDLCDLSARATFHPLYALARFVARTDVAEWCDAAAQALLLDGQQTLVSIIVKMYRNNMGVVEQPPTARGKTSGSKGGGDDSVLCLTRFRFVPVPATHMAFLAVQYIRLPTTGRHLLLPPPTPFSPRQHRAAAGAAAAAASASAKSCGWKKPPPSMEGKPLPRTNPAGITDIDAASFDSLPELDAEEEEEGEGEEEAGVGQGRQRKKGKEETISEITSAVPLTIDDRLPRPPLPPQTQPPPPPLPPQRRITPMQLLQQAQGAVWQALPAAGGAAAAAAAAAVSSRLDAYREQGPPLPPHAPRALSPAVPSYFGMHALLPQFQPPPAPKWMAARYQQQQQQQQQRDYEMQMRQQLGAGTGEDGEGDGGGGAERKMG